MPKNIQLQTYQSTSQFLTSIDTTLFKEEFILLKGARVFEFEKINSVLQYQVHETQLEVNLSALVHNFKVIKIHLNHSHSLCTIMQLSHR